MTDVIVPSTVRFEVDALLGIGGDMAEGARGFGRRRLLSMGAAGGIAVVASDSPASAGPADDESGGHGSHVVGEVVQPPSGDQAMAVSVDGRVMDIQPLDFPDGWVFRSGDLLTVDTRNQQGYPYVRTDSAQGDGLVALSKDPRHERIFGSPD